MLEKLFRLEANGTTVGREVVAGATTFLTMAYIIFVNPQILAEAGMDKGAVFVATCLAAAIGTAVMGLIANYPVAQAPGMGLNAFFTYTVVQSLGYSWQAALGAVFVSGVVFLILSVLPVREWLINAIPRPMKTAIAAGIGLFLATIGLKNAGVIVADPATLVTVGHLMQPGVGLAALGFVVIAALSARRVPGAILISVLGVTALGIAFGLIEPAGVVSMPPSLLPTLFAMDLGAALHVGMLSIVFAFLFVDLFDTAGTLIGLAHRGELLDKHGRLPRLGRALLADSTATVAGACLGTSPVTSYIESAAGIDAGGRTGLTAVVTALGFVLALFFAPVAGIVPPFATAPALLFVACLMLRGLTEINWDDVTDVTPAVITAIAMPLTFSIATGIGLGFMTYVAIKALAGRFREINVASVVIAVAFAVKFIMM